MRARAKSSKNAESVLLKWPDCITDKSGRSGDLPPISKNAETATRYIIKEISREQKPTFLNEPFKFLGRYKRIKNSKRFEIRKNPFPNTETNPFPKTGVRFVKSNEL